MNEEEAEFLRLQEEESCQLSLAAYPLSPPAAEELHAPVHVLEQSVPDPTGIRIATEALQAARAAFGTNNCHQCAAT